MSARIAKPMCSPRAGLYTPPNKKMNRYRSCFHKTTIYIAGLVFIFLFSKNCWSSLSLHLSAPEKNYCQEEHVILNLEIRNTSQDNEKITFPYLQPKEKNCLFIGKDFLLDIQSGNNIIENFTNHMPPEPKPGKFEVVLEPGKQFSCNVPFPYYYYGDKLPQTFAVTVKYKNLCSNTVKFSVEQTQGTQKNNNLLSNGDFSQGSNNLPYGWKKASKTVTWDKNNHLLKFSLDKPTAFGEGLWIYSIYYPIKAPCSFTLKLTARSTAPEIIVFIEGWGIVKGRKRRLERTECFAHPEKETEWKQFSFPVRFDNPRVQWVRVKLYSYLKPGCVYFDKVILIHNGHCERIK